MKYSSNPRSRLNTARCMYKMARTMISCANRGHGDIRLAMSFMSMARTELMREMVATREALS